MVQLAGSPDRVVPGRDALQFQKFPIQGRLASIKLSNAPPYCVACASEEPDLSHFTIHRAG